MPDQDLTLERAAARFVVEFGSANLDAAARDDVRSLMRDQLSNQVGAVQLPWSKQVRAFRTPRPGKATIVGEKTQAAAADAAYLNATYGHGFEYDDFNGNAHPGCCVIPTAIAIGEEVGATLEQVVVAMIAGYETYVRIGYLGSPALLNAGWQSHCVLGNFGAAAIAAKLYGLDEEQTFNALGIALSHASGPTEYASTGGSIKRVHAGIAVRNGIESADLARVGITAPRRFLTGDRGFYRMFPRMEIGDDARDIFKLDAPLQLRILKFKPFCCCAATHGYIQALAQVRDRVRDIESIDTNIQTMSDAIVGTRNANIYQPRNIEELQYSLPVQMAMSALNMGNGYKTHLDYMEGRLTLDPGSDAVQLAKRIRLNVSKDLDARFPRTFVAELTVNYRNGEKQHIFVDKIKGTPDNPFTREEHQAKCDELTREAMSGDAAARMFDIIDRLPPDLPIRELTSLLQK